MEQLIVSLTGRSGEQAKTRRAKQALQLRMEPELNCLARWLAGGYAGFGLLPAALQQHATTVANTQQWCTGARWVVGRVGECRVVWVDGWVDSG